MSSASSLTPEVQDIIVSNVININLPIIPLTYTTTHFRSYHIRATQQSLYLVLNGVNNSII